MQNLLVIPEPLGVGKKPDVCAAAAVLQCTYVGERGEKRVFFSVSIPAKRPKSLLYSRYRRTFVCLSITRWHTETPAAVQRDQTFRDEKISTTKSISSSVLTFLFRRRRRDKKREGVTQRYSAPPPGLNGSGYSNPGTRVRYPRVKTPTRNPGFGLIPGYWKFGEEPTFLGGMRHAIFLPKYFFACYSTI